MTVDEILAKYPDSIIIALSDPYNRRVRFVRDNHLGQHPIDPPSDFRIKFDGLLLYKPVVRRKMGRA